MAERAFDWTGMSYPFRLENGGVAKSKSVLNPKDKNSPHLAESIRQIVTTEVSERLVNMELGLKIRPYQFATFSDEFDTYISYEVQRAIEEFDTRIKVTEVIVNRDKRRGKVAVVILWTLNAQILGGIGSDGYRTEILFGEGGVAE